MAQASVLTDTEIRRVFRIIGTTRHVERNRLAFALSIFAGLRVGEIAALTVGDVATANGDVRREIKLGAHQTIATQQPSFHQCDAVDAVQGNLRDSRHPNVLTFGQTDFRDALE